MVDILIHDLPWARFLAGNNELKLRAKTVAEAGTDQARDALFFRMQVPAENIADDVLDRFFKFLEPFRAATVGQASSVIAGSGWLGGIAADIIDSHGIERVQIKIGFKLDPGPVIEAYLMRPGSAGNDADEVRLFRFALDGIEFAAPLKGVNSVPIGPIRQFRSDDDRYVYNVQGDPTPEYPSGRIVQYDRHGSDDPAQWKAVAILKPEPLAGV